MSIRRSTAEESFTPGQHPGAGAPGKSPTSARIGGRPQVVFRVESAEAAAVLADRFGPRDDNGVAAGADAAVARASSSTGSPLPATVQRQFESSLGADLGGVRVHTGADSAASASAVGARAYTTGQDIHFADGQYAPSDPFGLHLLAHEVAHTVQQSGGGAPAGAPQYKLDVSSPQDAAEVEADRAADAMVAGKSASVAGLARSVARKEGEGGGDKEPPGPKSVDGKSGGLGTEAAFSFEYALPLVKDAEVEMFSINASIGGEVGVKVGAKEEEKKEPESGTTASFGIGTSHEAGSDEPGKSTAALKAEVEHKFKAKPLDFEISSAGEASMGPGGVSLGIGVKLSHELGPFKVEVEPLTAEIIAWQPGKEPEFGSVKCSLKVVAPELKYELEHGREATLSTALKLEISGGVKASTITKWLAKKYGEDVLLDGLLDGVGAMEAVDLAVGMAPLALGFAVGAASIMAVSSAKGRGELDRALEEAALDTKRANFTYAALMTGGDDSNLFMDGGEAATMGKRQMMAETRAFFDIQKIATQQKIPVEQVKQRLRKQGKAFNSIVKAGEGAYPAFVKQAREAVLKFRDDNMIYSSATTAEQDIKETEKLVDAILYGGKI